jgi:large conductance mechanosensitive channel
MFKGFRDFIMRGNVVDLAVAVIIGAAFGAITTSLVKDIITPFIAAIVGKPDFSALVLTVGSGKITYGNFLNACINFVLQAGAVYFFVVLPIQKLMARLHPETPAEVTTKACAQCLSDVPLAATRCKFCTQPV